MTGKKLYRKRLQVAVMISVAVHAMVACIFWKDSFLFLFPAVLVVAPFLAFKVARDVYRIDQGRF